MKIFLICSIFLLVGLCFIIFGCYFLSKKYLESLCENEYDRKKRNSRKKVGKSSGYFSLAIGVMTMIFGLFFVLFPQAKYFIALFYMILLSIGVCVLVVFFKSTEK